MPYKPFPCSLSLSEQTCKQLRFPSEVVSGDVFFFFFSPHVPDEGEVGEWIRGDWEAGLQIKGEMCLALGGTAYSVYKQSLNGADFGFSGGGAPGRRSTRPVERNPIRAFS